MELLDSIIDRLNGVGVELNEDRYAEVSRFIDIMVEGRKSSFYNDEKEDSFLAMDLNVINDIIYGSISELGTAVRVSGIIGRIRRLRTIVVESSDDYF